MATKKEKVHVHYYKIGVAQKPEDSDILAGQADINANVTGIVSCEFLRTTMKTVDED